MLAPSGPQRLFLTRIPIRVDQGLVLVPTADVVVIAAHGARLSVTTSDQREYSFGHRLKDLEARLDPAEFVRLNRSMILNLSTVSRIVPGSAGTNTVILRNGQELGMSRKQAQRLRRILLELLE